jgi:hypothetical protein
MQFEENKEKFIMVPNYKNSFIYFLLKNNEVVYVGQTKKGISRPFAHTNKDYDSIRIMYCKNDELDYFEDKYITKYKPIYNKQVNYKYNYSFTMVKGLIRKNTNLKDFNLIDLKKIIKILDIKISFDYNVFTITFNDYEKIYNFIKGGNYVK